MKKIFALCLFLCAFGLYAESASSKDVFGVGLDFALNANGATDFGMSAGITAPWFFGNHFSFKSNGGIFFRKNADWKTYYQVDFYFMGGSLMESANIRLYGGGGPIFVFPASADEKKVLFGGGGFFGFEFYVASEPTGFSYFIELGGSGFATKKSFDINGFTAKTGFRYCIPVKK